MDINHNLIDGCPLCNIFIDPEHSVVKEFVFIEKDDINKADFIVITQKLLTVPMVVVRDHVPTISSDLWGKILYYCRNEYGAGVRLRGNIKNFPDHFHSYIIVSR